MKNHNVSGESHNCSLEKEVRVHETEAYTKAECVGAYVWEAQSGAIDRAEGISTLMIRENVMKENAVASVEKKMHKLMFLSLEQQDNHKFWFFSRQYLINLYLWFMHNC